MNGDFDINSPGEEVTIDGPHRGDIRCALLLIAPGGSVFGNVMADEVRVAGRFDGTAYAKRFLAAASAKVNGAVNAGEVGIKPGARVRAHLGPEFPAPFGAGLHPAHGDRSLTDDVDRAVSESIDVLLEAKGMTGAATVSRAAAPTGTQSSKPRSFDAPGAAISAAGAPVRGVRRPLPSIV